MAMKDNGVGRIGFVLFSFAGFGEGLVYRTLASLLVLFSKSPHRYFPCARGGRINALIQIVYITGWRDCTKERRSTVPIILSSRKKTSQR